MSGNNGWMPLYIGDYLGDTMELDGAQHGAYLLLLMYYWRNGPLPADDVKLAQIARTDPRAWKKTVGPVVRPFFTEINGRLHQKRADIELAKACDISAKRKAAAGSRWNGHNEHPPDGDANASANALQVDMQKSSKPDASGDAKGMLRASASQLHSPVQKKESSKNILPLTPKLETPSRAREETPPTDALRTLLNEASVTEPVLPSNAYRPLKPATNSVGPGAVAAQVNRVAKACAMTVPYGVVRSRDQQITGLAVQPEVEGADGLKWQPADPVRSPDEQVAQSLGISLTEATALLAANKAKLSAVA